MLFYGQNPHLYLKECKNPHMRIFDVIDFNEASIDRSYDMISKEKYMIDEIQFGEFDEHLYDEEDETYDLIINNMSLNWSNNLEESFKNFHRLLKPNGVYIGSLLGGDTL